MDQLKEERQHLGKIREWMESKERDYKNEIENLEKRVSTLFMQSKGTFSQDYELAYNLLNIKKQKEGNLNESFDRPYFGRIDFREKVQYDSEKFYIGKHSIRDEDTQDELVVDWRAPIADLYYSQTVGRCEYLSPSGFIEGDLKLKRRFTYTKDDKKDIDAIFDEGDQIIVNVSPESEGNALADEFLRINLEESSTEKLKEIVATIAKEQNEIIRAPKNIPIIVQGSAGAGKTTVALHRLAFLLYKHKDTLKGSDVCIIAPNSLFLDYISEVLPDLGTENVVQTTLEDLILKEMKLKKYSMNKDDILKSVLEESEEVSFINSRVSRLKGSLRYKELLDEIYEDTVSEESNLSDLKVSSITLYSKEELIRLFKEDLQYLALNARKKEMEVYCIRNIKIRLPKLQDKINESCDKKIRVFKNMFRDDEKVLRKKLTEIYDERDLVLKNLNKAAKDAVKQYFKDFKKTDTVEVYKEHIEKDGLIEKYFSKEKDEVKKLLSSFDKSNIHSDDLTPLMYLNLKINGSDKIFSHLVVDEAQDYSLLQIELMRMMVRQDSMTLVGDIAQGIYSYRSFKTWESVISLLNNNASYYKLRQSYRSTVEIIEEANKTLEKMNLSIEKAIPVLRHGPKAKRIEYNSDVEFKDIINDVRAKMNEKGRNTLAIVTKTFKEADELHKVLKKSIQDIELIDEKKKRSSLKNVIIPSYMTKGLEFDCIVMVDENDYSDNPLDLRLKYVSLTRALHMEYILKKRT